MATTGDLMLRTIDADTEYSIRFPQPQPAPSCLEDDLELRVQVDENFAAKSEILLVESEYVVASRVIWPSADSSEAHSTLCRWSYLPRSYLACVYHQPAASD